MMSVNLYMPKKVFNISSLNKNKEICYLPLLINCII